MKKVFALLSFVAFLSVSVNAQTTQVEKQEASKDAPAAVKAEAKSKSMSCCTKANKACCKNNTDAKACTPEQRAACAKAGSSDKASSKKSGCSHDHSKAEAAEETKESKSGTR